MSPMPFMSYVPFIDFSHHIFLILDHCDPIFLIKHTLCEGISMSELLGSDNHQKVWS